MARWSEYFQKLLNVPGDIEPGVLENIQKCSVNTALDEKPTMDEMVRAIKGLKDGKTPGGDGIPAEVWKYGGANLYNRLHQWIIKIWEEGHVPQSWKVANIVTIYKKRDVTECSNYRGISLLSAAGKIFARILLNRLSSHITPEVVPEIQCGFRSNRSTVDMIFCLRQLQEKCIQQDRTLYIVFVDFTKAFDTVGRTGLWQLLRKYGCPEKFTTMIESLHTGMMVNVRNGGEVSDTFAITNVSSRGAYWLTRFSLYFCQQCLKRLSETWGTEFTSNHARMQTSLQLHTPERRQNHKYTCERTAFCRRQRNNCPLSRGDPEDC